MHAFSSLLLPPLIFCQQVHYHPWVYEELNNLLLNVLCNDRRLDDVG
jgi:hypothetical protein